MFWTGIAFAFGWIAHETDACFSKSSSESAGIGILRRCLLSRGWAVLRDTYRWQFMIVPEGGSEFKPHLVSPSRNPDVAAIVVGDVEIPSAAITDVVWELIFGDIFYFGFCRLPEPHPLLDFGKLVPHLVDEILPQEPSILVLDVGVSAAAVGLVVDDAALGGADDITLH